MKKFLIGFIAALTLIFPNIVQADALDDFKKILESKHFFIKYIIEHDSNAKRDKGYLYKDKKTGYQIAGDNGSNAQNMIFEASDRDNFYLENKIMNDSVNCQLNPAQCQLKIENKLFMFFKTECKGKIDYATIGNLKYAIYEEVDKNFEFPTAFTSAINALLNKEQDIDSGKYIYNRAGSGRSEDGLSYFDIKADTGNENLLNAVRYYFDGNTIKKIAIAGYYKNPKTNEVIGQHMIINVEEFGTNPDQNYFKLPDKFKKIKSVKEHSEEMQKR